ncbi:MAG: hypothetical protein ACRC33_10615 [Gemmataceae bacterium]
MRGRDEPRPWHRWFGLTWMDFFHGTGVTVEPEKDTAVQQQRLDVLIVGRAPPDRTPPDGFDDLGPHNLITFKSHRETLDEWALIELVAHFVSEGTRSLLTEMFRQAIQEGRVMANQLQEYLREAKQRFLREITTEERLEGIPTEKLLESIPAEELVKRLTVEELLAALPPETLEALRRTKPAG